MVVFWLKLTKEKMGKFDRDFLFRLSDWWWTRAWKDRCKSINFQ